MNFIFRHILLWCFALLALAGCNSSYPDEVLGGIVRGVVTFPMSAADGAASPALGVYAYPRAPSLTGEQPALPNASHLYLPEDFVEDGSNFQIDYQLSHLAPANYVVLALLIDLERPPKECLAVGAYHNIGVISGTLDPPVEVLKDSPTEDIDFSLMALRCQDFAQP
jgi:hypothetical protein